MTINSGKYTMILHGGAWDIPREMHNDHLDGVEKALIKGCELLKQGKRAMDQQGDIAVATSTGGTPAKMPGRVGDSPLIGCGAYADNLHGGASATGWGESLMNLLLAKSTIDFIEKGAQAQSAAKKAISILEKRVDGRGGVICIDRQGRGGYAFNTPYMARPLADKKGISHIGIKPA